MARVANYMAADGMNSIAKENVWFSHDLVRHDRDGIEGSGEADEFVHVFVEFLLAKGKGFSAYVFAAEVGGKGVDYDEADIVVFYDLVGVFEEEDLVVAGICIGYYDVAGRLLRV